MPDLPSFPDPIVPAPFVPAPGPRAPEPGDGVAGMFAGLLTTLLDTAAAPVAVPNSGAAATAVTPRQIGSLRAGPLAAPERPTTSAAMPDPVLPNASADPKVEDTTTAPVEAPAPVPGALPPPRRSTSRRYHRVNRFRPRLVLNRPARLRRSAAMDRPFGNTRNRFTQTGRWRYHRNPFHRCLPLRSWPSAVRPLRPTRKPAPNRHRRPIPRQLRRQFKPYGPMLRRPRARLPPRRFLPLRRPHNSRIRFR
jgi:hypothetical protein